MTDAEPDHHHLALARGALRAYDRAERVRKLAEHALVLHLPGEARHLREGAARHDRLADRAMLRAQRRGYVRGSLPGDNGG